METVAAAASIAGIITLAAQATEGLRKLHSFFTEISTASKTISRLLSDINSLINTLTNIDDVLSHVELQRQNQNFASLDIKLEDCSKDVGLWLETAKALRPGGEKGGRALVRRVKFVARAEVVGRIREEIGRHRQALGLSLSVFGRTIDLHTSDQIYQMRGRFDDALTASLSSHGAHQDTLRRIEHYSITSLQSSAHSIRSMDSIRTELSRLEAMITSTRNASTSRIEHSEEHPPVGSSGNQGLFVHEGDHGYQTRVDRPLSSVPGYLTDQNSRNGSSSASHYSSSGSSILHTEISGKPDALTHPADFHCLVKEQEDISKRFSEISNANESALLYAQFSRDTSPMTKVKASKDEECGVYEVLDDDYAAVKDKIEARADHLNRARESRQISQDSRVTDGQLRAESARTSISQRVDGPSTREYKHNRAPEHKSPPKLDRKSTHALLEQSLSATYPPIIAEYLSLQCLTMTCQRHIALLEERQHIGPEQHSQVENNTKYTPSHLRLLRDRLEELQDAVDISFRECVDAGVSEAELREAVSVICGSGPLHDNTHHASARSDAQTLCRDEEKQEKDDQADESDAYFSSME